MTLANRSTSAPSRPRTSSSSLRSPRDQVRHRERLDATILRSFGERRALRSIRTTQPSFYWDRLESVVTHASTRLWEISSASVHIDISDDLLAFCAFLAREIEVTEGLDLEASKECARLGNLAHRAIAALDEISSGLVLTGALPSVSSSGAPPNFFTHALSEIIRTLRAELVFARDEMPCAFRIAA
jgi:hypothetical protein